jgi:hypothetical protein
MATVLLSKQTTGMKPEHAQILVECRQRMDELSSTNRPPDWQVWATDEYDEQIEHGPRYGAGEWFGPLLDHERMRLRRAIDDLQRGGLLVTWRRYGRRLSNIKLTPKGREVAKQLTGITEHPPPFDQAPSTAGGCFLVATNIVEPPPKTFFP